MEKRGKLEIPPSIWSGQWLNAICLLTLLIVISVAWNCLGKPYPSLFWLAVSFPIVHQIFVWLAWRLELRSAVTSKIIGFRVYLVFFFLLFGGRFVSLFALAWQDRGSLHLGAFLRISSTVIFSVLGIYAIYSVLRYFGLMRAAGADHFDPRYRDMPFVRQGIFRFTSNGMYLYAFLLFWAIAIVFNSSAAFAVAAFSHAYIWVHFYST
ncbi:MAG: methyltransferase, partial [Desulfobacterales bacterium]